MECFSVQSDELRGRLDPFYYKNEFRIKYKKILESPYTVVNFDSVIYDLKNGVEIRQYSENGYRYLRVTDMDEFGINTDNPRYVDVEKIPEKIKLSRDDFLISRSGSLGLVSIVTDEILNSIISSHIFKVNLNMKKIKPQYLEAYLRSSLGQFQFIQKNNGAIVPEIDQTALKTLKIVLPPENIQNQIIQIMVHAYQEKKKKEKNAKFLLNSINEFIINNLKVIPPDFKNKKCFSVNANLLEKKRIDAFFHSFGILKLSDNSPCKLKKMGELVKFSKEMWNQIDNFDEEFPYIEISDIDLDYGKIKNVSFYKKSEAPSRAKMIIRENDILVSTTRPHRGAIAIVDKSMDGYIASTGFAILRDLKLEDLSKEYLYRTLRSDMSLNQMLQRSSGGNYPAITIEELNEIQIPIPPQNIQNELITQINSKINQAEMLVNDAKDIIFNAKKEVEKIILGE